MKIYLAFALVLMATLTGCGGSSGGDSGCTNSTLNGTWTTQSNSTLIISPNCTFINDACGSTGTVANSTTTSGVVPITVTTNTVHSGACLTVGSYNCTYAVSPGNSLSFVCQ